MRRVLCLVLSLVQFVKPLDEDGFCVRVFSNYARNFVGNFSKHTGSSSTTNQHFFLGIQTEILPRISKRNSPGITEIGQRLPHGNYKSNLVENSDRFFFFSRILIGILLGIFTGIPLEILLVIYELLQVFRRDFPLERQFLQESHQAFL